jgi:hypothetical protein
MTDHEQVTPADDEEIPVCTSCFSPVEAGTNYCTRCGVAVGQHTEYVPFVNIRWQADGVGRLLKASRAEGAGALPRFLGALARILLTPIIWAGIPFAWLAERREARKQ